MKSRLMIQLKRAARRDRVRLHMPGAKGRALGFLHGIFRYDFTEIPGLDNLFEPTGVLAQSQREMAADIGAAEVFYTVNGSSSGVMALLSLFRGKKVLMARDFHISAAHAIEVFGLRPVFIDLPSTEISAVVRPEQIADALNADRGIAAVYLTYPNYYGYCADITKIAKIANRSDVPLLLDAAHSACFPYSNRLPVSPAKAGADAWVVSTHKTLPALNASGYVAVGRRSRISGESLKEALNAFVTTSPSYPVLASIDFAKAYMAVRGKRKVESMVRRIEAYSAKIDALSGFHVCCSKKVREEKDTLKWVIDYQKTGRSTAEISERLRKKGIIAEAADPQVVLFLMSPADRADACRRVYRALKSIKPAENSKPAIPTIAVEKTVLQRPKSEATVWVNLQDAVGKIAAKAVAVYPPGVPVVIKNQKLTKDGLRQIEKAQEDGLSLVGLNDKKQIRVFDEK